MSKRRKQKVIYTRFQEMCEMESDPHWKGEFERASFGKFPPKITFKGGILIFSKNNKKERMTIPADIFQAIENYKKFVIKNTLNKSRIECEEDNRKNEEKILNAKSIEQYEWKEIKKKKVKEVLILNFINKLSEVYQLDTQQKYELHVLVQINLILKRINPATIDYKEGEIKSITNLYYDETERRFVVSGGYQKKKDTGDSDYSLLNRTDLNDNVSYADEWKKFIDAYINKNELVYNTIHYETSIDVSSY